MTNLLGHLALVLGDDGPETIVVTRHPSLIVHLRSKGMIPAGTKIISHVNAPEEIRGKHVIGILPLHWAAFAERVTEVPLDLPPEARGRELSIEEIERFARTPRTYRVTQLGHPGIVNFEKEEPEVAIAKGDFAKAKRTIFSAIKEAFKERPVNKAAMKTAYDMFKAMSKDPAGARQRAMEHLIFSKAHPREVFDPTEVRPWMTEMAERHIAKGTMPLNRPVDGVGDDPNEEFRHRLRKGLPISPKLISRMTYGESHVKEKPNFALFMLRRSNALLTEATRKLIRGEGSQQRNIKSLTILIPAVKDWAKATLLSEPTLQQRGEALIIKSAADVTELLLQASAFSGPKNKVEERVASILRGKPI